MCFQLDAIRPVSLPTFLLEEQLCWSKNPLVFLVAYIKLYQYMDPLGLTKPLRNDAWKTTFLLGRVTLQGLLKLRGCTHSLDGSLFSLHFETSSIHSDESLINLGYRPFPPTQLHRHPQTHHHQNHSKTFAPQDFAPITISFGQKFHQPITISFLPPKKKRNIQEKPGSDHIPTLPFPSPSFLRLGSPRRLVTWCLVPRLSKVDAHRHPLHFPSGSYETSPRGKVDGMKGVVEWNSWFQHALCGKNDMQNQKNKVPEKKIHV